MASSEENSLHEDFPYEENSLHDDDAVSYGKKKIRGLTEMKDVTHAKSLGYKLNIAWNAKGQPINPGRSKFVHYIGVVTRREVPISYNNWRAVPRSKKEAIWEEIESTFYIDASRKRYVLLTASKILRGFRNTLTTKYMRDRNGNIIEQPPSKFAHLIKQEDWDAFIGRRKDESFQKISEENRQRSLNLLYPYRRGQTGYALLEQQLIAQKGEQVTTLPRHELWKEGHVNKEGQIDNEHVQQVWNKCVALLQSPLQDEVSSQDEVSGRNDILAKALGSIDPAGRVRGLGFGVTQKAYFGKGKRVASAETAQLREMLEQQTKKVEALEQEIQELSYLKEIVQQQALLIENLIQTQGAGEQAADLANPSFKNSCPLLALQPFEEERVLRKSKRKTIKKT